MLNQLHQMAVPPLPKGALAQHVIVLGKTRSGKSSKMRLIAEGCLDANLPVGIIDPKGDWWGIKSSATGKSAGYPVVIFGGKECRHADVKIDEHSGKAVAELVAAGNRPFLIDLGGWMPSPRTKFFVDFASRFFTLASGHRILFIDECHNFAPQGKVMDPMAGKSLHWANRLASEGAGKGITLISASQRPQKVHKDYVTSHETLIACRVIHPLDRGAIKDWVDGCGDPAKGAEVIKSLAALKRPEAWVWSPEINFGPERVTFPLFKTYDSFKPQQEVATKLKGWADVDLQKVEGQLAEIAAREKANDPAELHRQIAKLESELAVTQKTTTPTVDQAEIKNAEKRGFDQAEKRLANKSMRALIKVKREALTTIAVELTKFANTVGESIKSLDVEDRALAIEFEPTRTAAARPTPMPPARPARPPVTAQSKPRAPAPSTGSSVTPPLQKIIDSIRWWNVFGVHDPEHPQVAFMAGYVPGSGTWNRYISALRSMSLIEPSGVLRLTEQGGVAAQYPDETPTKDHLRQIIFDKLKPPLRSILVPIVAAYPAALSHDATAAQTKYVPGSGTWNRYVSSLRSLRLIEPRGDLRAQDWIGGP